MTGYASHGRGTAYGIIKTASGDFTLIWENNVNTNHRRADKFYNLTGDVLKIMTGSGVRVIFTFAFEKTGWSGNLDKDWEKTCIKP